MTKVNVGDVSGPRWVGGVTNPDTRDAEVEALRAENKRLQKIEGNLSAHIVQVAAERDALVVENGRLRERRVKERVGLVSRIRDYRAERDELRAQLDNMTPEWALRDEASGYIHGPYYEKRRLGDHYTELERLVSPWTTVEGDN